MKRVNYIVEENFKVEILVENNVGEVKYKFIENGVEDDYWMNGYVVVEEDGSKNLYHSKEEYYYDNKKEMVKF